MVDQLSHDSPVYEIEHLVKINPRQVQPANQDISLRIYPGEIFGFWATTVLDWAD